MKKINHKLVIVLTTLILALAIIWIKPWHYLMTTDIDRKNLFHDDYLVLKKYGTKGDVESLIAHLYKMDPGHNESDEKRIYLCTYLHCIDALKSITGVDNGLSKVKWFKWYRKVHGRSVELKNFMDNKE
jgi:hypothetical protein